MSHRTMAVVPAQPPACCSRNSCTLDDHLTGFREDTDPGAQAALPLWRCGGFSRRLHARRHLAVRRRQLSCLYRDSCLCMQADCRLRQSELIAIGQCKQGDSDRPIYCLGSNRLVEDLSSGMSVTKLQRVLRVCNFGPIPVKYAEALSIQDRLAELCKQKQAPDTLLQLQVRADPQLENCMQSHCAFRTVLRPLRLVTAVCFMGMRC